MSSIPERGERPCSSAVAYKNGLSVDPTCRLAVVMLIWLWCWFEKKSMLPSIVRT